jgi:hypothetical protein
MVKMPTYSTLMLPLEEGVEVEEVVEEREVGEEG